MSHSWLNIELTNLDSVAHDSTFYFLRKPFRCCLIWLSEFRPFFSVFKTSSSNRLTESPWVTLWVCLRRKVQIGPLLEFGCTGVDNSDHDDGGFILTTRQWWWWQLWWWWWWWWWQQWWWWWEWWWYWPPSDIQCCQPMKRLWVVNLHHDHLDHHDHDHDHDHDHRHHIISSYHIISIPADMSKNSGLSKARRPKIQILLKTIYNLAFKVFKKMEYFEGLIWWHSYMTASQYKG